MLIEESYVPILLNRRENSSKRFYYLPNPEIFENTSELGAGNYSACLWNFDRYFDE
jgi:hypothetical protein